MSDFPTTIWLTRQREGAAWTLLDHEELYDAALDHGWEVAEYTRLSAHGEFKQARAAAHAAGPSEPEFKNALDAWAETHGASQAARDEMELILNRGRNVAPKVVLEIGAHQGASLRMWMQEFEPVLTIGVEVEDSERTRAGLDTLEDATIIFGDSTSVKTYREVVHALDGMPVDFLYIDGDHSETAVVTDWGLYGSLVRRGGLIVLDDTKREPGVQALADSITFGRRYKTLRFEPDGDSTGKLLVWQGDARWRA